jgi:hypothetical protein
MNMLTTKKPATQGEPPGEVHAHKTSDDAKHDRADKGEGEIGCHHAQFAGEGHGNLPGSLRRRGNAKQQKVFRLLVDAGQV